MCLGEGYVSAQLSDDKCSRRQMFSSPTKSDVGGGGGGGGDVVKKSSPDVVRFMRRVLLLLYYSASRCFAYHDVEITQTMLGSVSRRKGDGYL